MPFKKIVSTICLTVYFYTYHFIYFTQKFTLASSDMTMQLKFICQQFVGTCAPNSFLLQVLLMSHFCVRTNHTWSVCKTKWNLIGWWQLTQISIQMKFCLQKTVRNKDTQNYLLFTLNILSRHNSFMYQ